MIEYRPKIWQGLTAAALLGAGTVLAACTPPAEKTASAPAAPLEGEAGEAAIGETGGEAGEAGTAEAYAGLNPAAAAGLRLQHLKGFLLTAEALRKAGLGAEASVLVDQAQLEIVRGREAELGGLAPSVLPTASAAAAANDAEGLKAAISAIDAAQASAGGAPNVDQIRRLLGVVRTVYGAAVTAEAVDPIEYQHSYAAALAARDALQQVATAGAAKPSRVFAISTEMDNLLKLWAGPVAPDKATPSEEVAAQLARVELALSGL